MAFHTSYSGRRVLSADGKAPSARRDDSLDNLRGILIFCVVVGHLLEICPPFWGKDYLYRLIYSFHMPAFLFLFGYFAKFNPRRILFGYALPYVIFQTLYITFAQRVLGADISLQYSTPYWLLWFLLVCTYNQLLIPLYDTESKSGQCLFLALSIVLALLVGFDDTVGYYASISRFFAFQLWFLMGFYYRKRETTIRTAISRHQTLWTCLSVAAVTASAVFLLLPYISGKMLYEVYPYETLRYSAGIRGISMLIAFSWICFLFGPLARLLNRKIPLLTMVGQNTLPVFLLHGFAVKAIPVFIPGLLRGPVSVLAAACVLLLILGNPMVGNPFQWMFSDRWLPYQKAKSS